MNRYAGNDNYGRPKSEYLAKIAAMTDKELSRECYSMIYMSAFCANNPRADWHWMVNACYEESYKRDPSATIYCRAHDRCKAEHA
jgi:hypothetical protein